MGYFVRFVNIKENEQIMNNILTYICYVIYITIGKYLPSFHNSYH